MTLFCGADIMAANATSSLAALNTTKRSADSRSSREAGNQPDVDFGTQYKSEIRNQAAKPANKSQPKSESAARDAVKESNTDSKPNTEQANTDSKAGKAESVAQTAAQQEATPADAKAAAPADNSMAAMLAMMQLVNQAAAPTTPTLKTDVADLSDGKALTSAADTIRGLLLPGADAGKKEEQDQLIAQPVVNDKQQLGQLVATQITNTPEEGVTAKIAADASAVLPLDGKNTLTNTAFTDVLAQKMAAPATNSPTSTAAANAALPSHYLETPVQDARWGDAVAQRVSLMLGKQEQQIEMQLNPPNLGPMEVRLNLGGEQASIVFTSQHAAVREALAAATPKLTALLADQGIVLSNVQVASDSLQQQQQQAQRQDNPYTPSQQPSPYASSAGLGNIAGVERILNLNDLRIPAGSTRVSLFV
jgi:flagellar hook-length control protein FliK